MMRQAARALRYVLFTIGVLLLLLTVVSYFVLVAVQLPVDTPAVRAFAMRSLLVISVHTQPGVPTADADVTFDVTPRDERQLTVGTLLPTIARFAGGPPNPYRTTLIRIPLWLLAFLCLAWPVTSFVISRRRRRGRGFAVEAKADSAVSPEDS